MRRLISISISIVFVLGVSVACDRGGGTEKAQNPQDALYVCNQGDATISIIGPGTDSVLTTVDLTNEGYSSNAKPHHVVVDPDGSAWYVSLIGANRIVKFNNRNEVVGTVEFESPGMLSLHPTEDLLYAGHTMSIPTVPSTVAVIDRAEMARVDVISVGIDRPHGMKVHPSGDVAYTTSLAVNDLAAIDTKTQRVEDRVSLPGSRQRYVQMDISADGKTAYVTGQVAGQVHILDLATPSKPTLTDSVTVGAEPWHPQLSDDGSTLYFGSKATNTVYALDTQTLDTTIIRGQGLAQPHGSALSPDGTTLFVSNKNLNGTYQPPSGEEAGSVVAINTATNAIERVIEVGEAPAGINTRWQP